MARVCSSQPDHRGPSRWTWRARDLARATCSRGAPSVDRDLVAQQRRARARTPASPPTASPTSRRAADEHRLRAERERLQHVARRGGRRRRRRPRTRPATASTTSGSASSVAGAPSSCRPPWFETTTAAAPCSTASAASSRREDSLERRPAARRSTQIHSRSRQVSDGLSSWNCSAGCHRDARRSPAFDVRQRQVGRDARSRARRSRSRRPSTRRVDGQHERAVAGLARLGDVLERDAPCRCRRRAGTSVDAPGGLRDRRRAAES